MSYLSGLMVFPIFFTLSEFCKKVALDLSHRQLLVFSLLTYRASPSLAAKNIINLILVLTIW